jgi:hypothetical protein
MDARIVDEKEEVIDVYWWVFLGNFEQILRCFAVEDYYQKEKMMLMKYSRVCQIHFLNDLSY